MAQAAIPLAQPVSLARPRWVRARGAGAHAAPIALAGALSLAAALLWPLDDPRLPFACPFRALTGLPCLGCGATHAFVHLAHGQLGLALQANPLWALAAAALWSCALFSLVRLGGLRWTLALPPLSARSARAARFALAFGAALNWAFVACQGR